MRAAGMSGAEAQAKADSCSVSLAPSRSRSSPPWGRRARWRSPAPEAPVAEPRPGGRASRLTAQRVGDRVGRPDGRVDADHESRQLADRRTRGDVQEQLRQLFALLPVARHVPHRPVRAQPQVVDNAPPDGGYPKFEPLHGNNNLAVWLQDAGYSTALIGKYLRLHEAEHRAAGLVGVARGGRGLGEGLRLHDERQRRPDQHGQKPTDFLRGCAHVKGGQLHRPQRTPAEPVLPLAHLHGPARERPGSESEPTVRLRRRLEAGAAQRPCIRHRAVAAAARTSTRRTSPTSRPRSGTTRS